MEWYGYDEERDGDPLKHGCWEGYGCLCLLTTYDRADEQIGVLRGSTRM